MKKGDIIYFDPLTKKQTPELADKKHPIICLEDVNSSKDHFLSAILSSGIEPQESPIPNIKLDMRFFESNPSYSIPGSCKQEYLVGMGIWKEISQLPQQENGRISLRGLNVVLCELLKTIQDEKQEELYKDLMNVVRNHVSFEYVSTDIKTHVKDYPLNVRS